MISKITIIYEDNDLLAINKPAGLLVHPVGKPQPTLVDWIMAKYPETKNVGEDPLRPGIVHRLDKETSGILLIAKNQKTFEYLKQQFQDKKIKKTYLALVFGKMKDSDGVINLPISKSKSDFRKKTVNKGAGIEREAVTVYRRKEELGEYSLLEVRPKTGRTHQIRVHLKAINHPVVCDKLYGPRTNNCPLGLSQHFLHAQSLEFTLPNGQPIKLEAEMPVELVGALERLRQK